MTKVLVTGANGFVGSHILEAFGRAPPGELQVIAACRRPDRLPAGFRGEVRQGDLRDPDYRRSMLDGIDVVCHAAAWTSAWRHNEASCTLFLQPTLDLLEDAVSAGVSRFIFLSSTSVAAPAGAGNVVYPADPKKLALWPHLANVARIEQSMRDLAGPGRTMLSLRVGLFAGERYGLGLLPMLVPRLKTHLVPWVAGGRTSMPVVAGPDIGDAFALAARAGGLSDYEAFHIVGPEVPTAREVIGFLHREYGIPEPHFGVPFAVAYAFARLMEWLNPVLPGDPLVTRSIVHLLEETGPDNGPARERLGYRPGVPWQEAIRLQMREMAVRQTRPMPMHVPYDHGSRTG